MRRFVVCIVILCAIVFSYVFLFLMPPVGEVERHDRAIVVSGRVEIDNSISIESDHLLYIKAGATLVFSNGSGVIMKGGRLFIAGSASTPVTFIAKEAGQPTGGVTGYGDIRIEHAVFLGVSGVAGSSAVNVQTDAAIEVEGERITVDSVKFDQCSVSSVIRTSHASISLINIDVNNCMTTDSVIECRTKNTDLLTEPVLKGLTVRGASSRHTMELIRGFTIVSGVMGGSRTCRFHIEVVELADSHIINSIVSAETIHNSKLIESDVMFQHATNCVFEHCVFVEDPTLSSGDGRLFVAFDCLYVLTMQAFLLPGSIEYASQSHGVTILITECKLSYSKKSAGRLEAEIQQSPNAWILPSVKSIHYVSAATVLLYIR